jgi:hypothetical protein
MNWQKALLYATKNAVNALIVNSSMWVIDPKDFNLHDHDALVHMGKMAVAVIFSREFTVWFPRLLKWSQTVNQE